MERGREEEGSKGGGEEGSKSREDGSEGGGKRRGAGLVKPLQICWQKRQAGGKHLVHLKPLLSMEIHAPAPPEVAGGAISTGKESTCPSVRLLVSPRSPRGRTPPRRSSKRTCQRLSASTRINVSINFGMHGTGLTSPSACLSCLTSLQNSSTSFLSFIAYSALTSALFSAFAKLRSAIIPGAPPPGAPPTTPPAAPVPAVVTAPMPPPAAPAAAATEKSRAAKFGSFRLS